jgi:hypothetical protein
VPREGSLTTHRGSRTRSRAVPGEVPRVRCDVHFLRNIILYLSLRNISALTRLKTKRQRFVMKGNHPLSTRANYIVVAIPTAKHSR